MWFQKVCRALLHVPKELPRFTRRKPLCVPVLLKNRREQKKLVRFLYRRFVPLVLIYFVPNADPFHECVISLLVLMSTLYSINHQLCKTMFSSHCCVYEAGKVANGSLTITERELENCYEFKFPLYILNYRQIFACYHSEMIIKCSLKHVRNK